MKTCKKIYTIVQTKKHITLSRQGSDHTTTGADDSVPAAEAANSSLATNANNTNKGVAGPTADNSSGYNKPVRTRAPPIRYSDARCHQALGLQHFGAKGRKMQHTTTIDQVIGQSRTKENTQRRLLTQAAGVINQLATALHTSLQATSDNTLSQMTLDDNMKHPTGESTLSLNESKADPSPPSRQPAANKARVAHKDLCNMLPAKADLLDSDNESSIDNWDDLYNNKEVLEEQHTVSTPESTLVVGQMTAKVDTTDQGSNTYESQQDSSRGGAVQHQGGTCSQQKVLVVSQHIQKY